jgi:hypothetical protein
MQGKYPRHMPLAESKCNSLKGICSMIKLPKVSTQITQIQYLHYNFINRGQLKNDIIIFVLIVTFRNMFINLKNIPN